MEETFEKQMKDSDIIFTAISTGNFDSYKSAELAVVAFYIPDLTFSRAGISHALKRLKTFYTCPSACYARALNKFIQELEEINNQTPWRETEPEWWLDMMEIQKLAIVKREKIEDERKEDNKRAT